MAFSGRKGESQFSPTRQKLRLVTGACGCALPFFSLSYSISYLAHDHSVVVAREFQHRKEQPVGDEELVRGDRGVQSGSPFTQELLDGGDLKVGFWKGKKKNRVSRVPASSSSARASQAYETKKETALVTPCLTHRLDLGGEGRDHRGLGLGESDAGVRHAQRSTVVPTVAAHAHDDARRDERVNNSDLLVCEVDAAHVRKGKNTRNTGMRRLKKTCNSNSPQMHMDKLTFPSGLTRANTRV